MTASQTPPVMIALVPLTVTNAGEGPVVIRVAGIADKTVAPGETTKTHPPPKDG